MKRVPPLRLRPRLVPHVVVTARAAVARPKSNRRMAYLLSRSPSKPRLGGAGARVQFAGRVMAATAVLQHALRRNPRYIRLLLVALFKSAEGA